MKRKSNKRIVREAKRVQKARTMLRPGGESDYARKKKYLRKHSLWGFDVSEPKPWKRAL